MIGRHLAASQVVVAVFALAGVTVLGLFDKVGEGALIAIYSGVIGAVLGAGAIIANGASTARVASQIAATTAVEVAAAAVAEDTGEGH